MLCGKWEKVDLRQKIIINRVTEARNRIGFSPFFVVELFVEILAISDMMVYTFYFDIAFVKSEGRLELKNYIVF